MVLPIFIESVTLTQMCRVAMAQMAERRLRNFCFQLIAEAKVRNPPFLVPFEIALREKVY